MTAQLRPILKNFHVAVPYEEKSHDISRAGHDLDYRVAAAWTQSVTVQSGVEVDLTIMVKSRQIKKARVI